MNKEGIIAVVVGLVIGSSLFLALKRAGNLVNLGVKKAPEPTVVAVPTVIETPTQASGQAETDWFKLITPTDYFLTKSKTIEFQAQVASGGGVLVRVNDKLAYYPALTSTVSAQLKLEAGANLLAFTGVNDRFEVKPSRLVSGVVSSQEYPDGAGGLAGQVIKVAGDVITLKADDGRVVELVITPETKMYSFTSSGRRVTLTAVDESLLDREVLAILQPFNEMDDNQPSFEVIKLLAISDWQVAPQRLFKGKITKIDDDKSSYQVVNLNNQVEEVTITDKVKIFDLNGADLKPDDLSLSDKVILYYLGDKVGLVLVSPQVNLLEE